MGTLPTLTVLLDDGTDTFPYDVSSRVLASDGYSISRGRDDWIGAVTAGELTLTLNNADGFFSTVTGGFDAGGFDAAPFGGTPKLINVDRKIRVKETVNGVTYTRFTGYAKSWPVAWPATVVTFSTVTPTATDAQARAERHTLRSMLEEEILADSPSAYYTLGEAQGSASAGDSSGNQAASLVPAGTGSAVVFGTGVSPNDGQTAATFAGGQHLAGTVTAGTNFALEVCFELAAPPVADSLVAAICGFGVIVDTSGHVRIDNLTGGPIRSTTIQVADGRVHYVGFSHATGVGFGTEVVVDNIDLGFIAAAWTAFTTVPLSVGGGFATAGVFNETFAVFTGSISHVAVTQVALSAARMIAHGTAAATGFAGESSTTRIARLASYAGLTVGTLDTSLTNMPAQATSGNSAWDAIQAVADAEGGLVFIDGSGNLTFHSRSRAWGKTTPDLILSSQYVTPDVQPVLDDQQIVNYLEVSAQGTGAVQVLQDDVSINGDGTSPGHGRYPDSLTYLVQTDQEAVDRGNWTLTKFAEPFPRYGTLTINLFGMTAAQAQAVIAALDLDCWLRVTSMASQNPGGTTADVMVEGWHETGTGESWQITCNVVDRSLFTALVLDDATFGALDSIPIGY